MRWKLIETARFRRFSKNWRTMRHNRPPSERLRTKLSLGVERQVSGDADEPEPERILFRCFTKRASLEIGADALDADSMVEREFLDDNRRPDLELSVFDIQASDWCRVYLQRMAAVGADPPRCNGGVDVKPLGRDAEDAPESGPFRLLRENHKVIRFADEAGLRVFVAELVAAMRDRRCRVFVHQKSEFRAWLKANKNDSEWAAFLATAPSDWQKFSTPT